MSHVFVITDYLLLAEANLYIDMGISGGWRCAGQLCGVSKIVRQVVPPQETIPDLNID
jgi:hypothetical protein